MTTSSSQPLTLDRAKLNLETSVKFVTRYMLQPVDSRASAKRYVDVDEAADKLYYFQSTCANGHTFARRVEYVQSVVPSLASGAQFNAMVATAKAAYVTAERLSSEEKQRKAGKRAAVQAKRDLKAELNLQDGVKLQGVDVGQYKAILAGLEPVRKHAYAQRGTAIIKGLQNVFEELKAVGNNSELWNPYPKNGTRIRSENYSAKNTWLSDFFEPEYTGNSKIVRLKGNHPDIVNAMATQYALAYVQGYAVKLALKTGETIANDPALAPLAAVLKVLRCTVSSPDLWRNSTATIVLSPDVREFSLQFHTQIIWNRSCLGLQFNQYPTRRVL